MMRTSGYLTVILLTLVGAGGLWTGGAGETGSVNPRGTIGYLEGDVFLNGGRAEIGQEVPPGAVIETAESS